MQHEFYRGGALRSETGTRRRLKAAIGAEETRWSATSIDLRHQIKGSAAAIWCLRVLARFGVRQPELDAIAPVMFHLEALVYRGDFEYENAQQTGDPVDPVWREGIEEILRAYALDTPSVIAALDELDGYFDLESSIMAGRTPLEPDLVSRSCYTRCSGATLLLRIGCGLARIDPGEQLFTLVRHLSAHDEITTDLPSYAEDLDEGMFNVYRLSDWIHGSGAAREQVRAQSSGMLRALRREVGRADRDALVLFAAVLPPVLPLDPRLPSVLPRLLPRQALARLVNLRIRFHSTTKPLRFPDLRDDARPDPRPVPLEAVPAGKTLARAGA